MIFKKSNLTHPAIKHRRVVQTNLQKPIITLNLVQILSSFVADGFVHRSFDYTKSTEKFIRLIDIFFDCVNVTTTYQGVKSETAALYPNKEPDD